MPRLLPVPAIELGLDDCRSFIDLIRLEGADIRSLACLQRAEINDICRRLAAPLLHAVELAARQALDDPDMAIFALDIPRGLNPEASHDALLAAAIAITIMGGLFEPIMDPANKTPFTVYNASPENEQRLMKAGLHYLSSSEKLGFHTDGSLDGAVVRVPEFIGLYNLLLNYRKPGNLYWVPFSLWEQMNEFAERLGWAVPYEVELTPTVYAGKGVVGDHEHRRLSVPIFSRPDHDPVVFFNGRVTGREPFSGTEIEPVIAQMKQSISLNPVRYYIPQRQRRLVLARNNRGFHARDMLEHPRPGCKYTRSFIRAVSKHGPAVAVRG